MPGAPFLRGFIAKKWDATNLHKRALRGSKPTRNQSLTRTLRFRLIAERLDPVHVRLPPKPGQLALGVVAVSLLRGRQRGLFGQGPLYDRKRLPIAKRIERLYGSR